MKKPINKKIILGFSIGDYNGIGPEILLKAFSNFNLFKKCIPVVFCNLEILVYYKKLLKSKIIIKKVKNLNEDLNDNCLNVFSCFNKNINIEPGKIKKSAGRYSIISLEESTNALINNQIHGIVTLPISKINSQNKNFNFPGHTEYFMSKFNVKNNIMIMNSNLMTLGLISGHIPLNRVNINTIKIQAEEKIRIFTDTLKYDLLKKNPKIAILGINPHAGENGLLGNEEIKVIIPLMNKLNRKERILYGPFPSDSFFGLRMFKEFDGVISWYHDQGLIGFKSFCFEKGVNFTGGLPIVRTSPDHGTGYNIAGKGIANEKSLLESIKLNLKIISNRNLIK